MTDFMNKFLGYAMHRAVVLSLFSLISITAFAQPDGGKLFDSQCKRCHNVGEAKLVGPGLKDVRSRWSSESNLIAWIQNSAEYLKTGDPYAVALYEKYNKSAMPAFPTLSKEDVVAILDYVDAENSKAPVAAAAPAGTEEPAKKSNDNTLMYVLIAVTVILSILIYSLYSITTTLVKILKLRDGEASVDDRSMLDKAEDFVKGIRPWAGKNKKVVGLLVTVVVLIVLKFVWDSLLGIGVYTNYQPHQPIKFSHKIHAGEIGISCVYCHTGVTESKQAAIPSASTCMNCHKGVKEGAQYGKVEIAKIYASIGFDPEKDIYIENYYQKPYEDMASIYENWLGDGDAYRQVQPFIQKPISWVQIHKLPDHAYFNHAQHFNVGGIECETCHGPVKEMEEVYQYSPLTMGWCINCHRETKVKYEENPYYDKLHDYLSKRYKEGAQFTVSRIGGLECGKCHY
jgi:cytochrome c2